MTNNTETILISSLDQLKTVLNLFYSKDMTYWQATGRQFFMFNYPNSFSYVEQTGLKYNLLGQIGSGTLTLDYTTRTATMTNSSRINNKTETLTSVVTIENNNFVLKTNYTYIATVVLSNIAAVKKTSAYTKALSILNNPNASDVDVANVIASATWTTNLNVPDILPTDVTLDVFKSINFSGKSVLTSSFAIKGISTQPATIRWWLVPDYTKVSWVPAATGNLLGEFITGQPVITLDTDLKNRTDNVIMSPKNVKIQCQAQYKLADGTMSSIMCTKTMDFSELPTFNYFNL